MKRNQNFLVSFFCRIPPDTLEHNQFENLTPTETKKRRTCQTNPPGFRISPTKSIFVISRVGTRCAPTGENARTLTASPSTVPTPADSDTLADVPSFPRLAGLTWKEKNGANTIIRGRTRLRSLTGSDSNSIHLPHPLLPFIFTRVPGEEVTPQLLLGPRGPLLPAWGTLQLSRGEGRKFPWDLHPDFLQNHSPRILPLSLFHLPEPPTASLRGTPTIPSTAPPLGNSPEWLRSQCRTHLLLSSGRYSKVNSENIEKYLELYRYITE